MKVLNAVLAALLVLATMSVRAQEAQTYAITGNEEVHVQRLDERQREINCLASNMFYEARGEPDKGKIAVGLVTINRVKSGGYPDSICGVVTQKKQFSWYRPGKIRSSGNSLFEEVRTIATQLYDEYYVANTYVDFVHGATHFHSTGVNPQWRKKKLVRRIGSHLFFRIGK